MTYEDNRKHEHDASTPHSAPAHVLEDGTPLSTEEFQALVIESQLEREEKR